MQPNFLAERDKKSFGSCDARRPQKLGSATENYEATMQPRNWPWGNATDLEAGEEFLGFRPRAIPFGACNVDISRFGKNLMVCYDVVVSPLHSGADVYEKVQNKL